MVDFTFYTRWFVCYVDAEVNPECVAVIRLLLLSADAAVLGSAADNVCDEAEATMTDRSTDIMTCHAVRTCLLPVTDVLLSAGSHVYLPTVRLHRAMMLMVTLTAELVTSQGEQLVY